MVYTKKAGKEFIRRVKQAVVEQGCPTFGHHKVSVLIDIHMPNDRGDHHNREKPTLDALEEAQVFKNDKQVVDLRVRRRHNVDGGRCHVTIWPRK